MARCRYLGALIAILFLNVSNALYLAGVGVGDITGPVADVNLMGYASPFQTAQGLHTRLYARAFMFADQSQPSRRFVYVSMDACMASQLVSLRVVQRLQEEYGSDLYGHDNVAISGTHTHASPAGFLQYLLYDITSLGFVQSSFDAMVEGTLEAIRAAHESLRPAEVALGSGQLEGASINRSPTAYLANPQEERDMYDSDVDTDISVLRIADAASGAGRGALGWFAVHCTSLNNTNRLVSADNKGAAQLLMEAWAAEAEARAQRLVAKRGFAEPRSAAAQGGDAAMVPHLDGARDEDQAQDGDGPQPQAGSGAASLGAAGDTEWRAEEVAAAAAKAAALATLALDLGPIAAKFDEAASPEGAGRLSVGGGGNSGRSSNSSTAHSAVRLRFRFDPSMHRRLRHPFLTASSVKALAEAQMQRLSAPAARGERDQRLLRFEPGFVAALAQASVGDTSPNTAGAYCLDTGLPCDPASSTCGGRNELCHGRGPAWPDDRASAALVGAAQFEAARRVYTAAAAAVAVDDDGQVPSPAYLSGPLDFRSAFLDMTNITVDPQPQPGSQPQPGRQTQREVAQQKLQRGGSPRSSQSLAGRARAGSRVGVSVPVRGGRTCPPAMGMSFAAGTTDGPGAFDFRQGDTEGPPLWRLVRSLVLPPSREQQRCQAPKPILLDTGQITVPYLWQPRVTQISLLRLGRLLIACVPGEFTTMAGRRLKRALQERFRLAGAIEDPAVVISGLTGTYSSYITTWEEYQVQRYEGASTLYGPHTLDAYIQEFMRLADAMIGGQPVKSEVAPPDLQSRQLHLLPDVLLDWVPPGSSFGDVVTQPQQQYRPGQTAQATFRAANPRNNLRRNGTFMAVEMLVMAPQQVQQAERQQRKDKQQQAGSPAGNNSAMESYAWAAHLLHAPASSSSSRASYRCNSQEVLPAGAQWVRVRDDRDWVTRFHWSRPSALSPESFASLAWDIPANTPPGVYRFRYSGDAKTLFRPEDATETEKGAEARGVLQAAEAQRQRQHQAVQEGRQQQHQAAAAAATGEVDRQRGEVLEAVWGGSDSGAAGGSTDEATKAGSRVDGKAAGDGRLASVVGSGPANRDAVGTEKADAAGLQVVRSFEGCSAPFRVVL